LQIEKYIQQQRVAPNPEEIFDKILQKSIYEKARDKMKEGKKKDENEQEKRKEPDYLAHILKNMQLEDATQLEEEAAIAVKNEALRSLKDRLLTRAEII
jgi:negative regulator of genetic competence, sporulation and motility